MSTIIPTTQTTIARFAAGLYGTKLGNPTLNAVLNDVQLSSANGINGLKTVLNSYYAPFAGQTSAQVAAIVVKNAGIVAGDFGLTPAQVSAAVAIVTAELNFAAPLGNQGSAIASILASYANTTVNDPVYGAAARAFNLKIDQANAHANNPANTENVPFGAVNTEFVLTAGNDRINGTDGNDTFIAGEGTLSSSDVINGGAGLDTLKASINGIISPTISNVERLEFQAQFRTFDSGDNNLADEQIVKVDFNTNVSKITGFTSIENSNSRADLIIEDVRIANNQKTEDITIVMRETDPGNVDFGVYFDQNSLRNEKSESSSINIFLMDTAAAGAPATAAKPLLNHNFNSYTFYDGNVKVVLGGANTAAGEAIDKAETYAELRAAFELALKTANVGGVVSDLSGTVVATLSGPVNMTTEALKDPESAKVANSFLSLTGQILTLTTNAATAIKSQVDGQPAGGWAASGTAPSTGAIVQTFNSGATAATGLVTSKIILDDVGRGSTGGDLVVGGLSVGETSTSKGVEKFLIEVQDNSKLQTINSTNNTLREVVITNGVTTRVNNAFNENQKDAGSLTVRGIEAPNDNVFNNPLPGAVAQHNQFGFSDVRLIDGSAMTGKLNFDAEITQASIAKYLNLKDGAPALPAADNVAFVYNGGANNDVITVLIDSSVAASRTLTGREDFTFTANGGAGDDIITVDIGGLQTNAWYLDQKSLKNITINGGTGNDTINTVGSGDFNVNAGDGNDVVYINNTGTPTIGAQWVVAAANTDLADLQLSTAAGTRAQFLYQGKLTVAFTGPNAAAAGGVTAGAADAVASPFSNGFEVTVDIPTAANFAVSQFHINQAIKAAINGNAVMNKLLVAEDGPANTLVIKSLVAGEFAATDLDINVTGATLTGLPANEQSTVLNAFKIIAGNSAATIADAQAAQNATVTAKNLVQGLDNSVLGTNTVAGVAVVANGTNSTDLTDNVINLGAGNDLVVLSTSASSNDILVYTGYDQGVDTIVNFSTAGSSIDYVDFRSYLNGKANGSSGSAESQTNIPISLAPGNVLAANSIKVLDLTGTTDAQTFAGLTAANLLAAVNSTNTGTANFAGITAATLDAQTFAAGTNNVVGNVGKSVVLVQNVANLGQYKAFELTFNTLATTNANNDFTEAKLIAEMDFGNSISTASLTGFNTSPGGGVVVPPVPGLTVVPVPATGATGTAAAELFTVDAVAALADAAGTNYQATITGFVTGADRLQIDMPLANAAITTLAQLNGVQGVSVQSDPFSGSTLVNFGNDANGGELATLTLTGVADAALVQVQII